MLQYSAYSDDEWSIFDNTCTSFALAIPVPHRIATAIRQRNNSGNLIYPDNNYPFVASRAFLSRRNPPFLSPPQYAAPQPIRAKHRLEDHGV